MLHTSTQEAKMAKLRSLLLLSPLGLLLLAPLAFRSPEPVGAPWLSIEVPANPMDAATRGAALVVRTYFHETPAGFPVTGTAEGIVNGERKTLPLELEKAAHAGVFAVKQAWPTEGDWMLVFALDRGDGPAVTLVVELGPNGGVQEASYFSEPTKIVATRSVQVIGGAVGAERIDSALRAMALRSD